VNFRYDAIDERGRKRSGVISASNAEGARKAILRDGLHVTEVHETDEPDDSRAHKGQRSSAGGVRLGGSNRLTNMVGFTRQMALLVSTGTPLTQALGAVEHQTKDETFRAVIAELRSNVETGSALSAAMADHPKTFDPVARSLVQAGESSGKLPDMLDRLAALARQQQTLSKSVKGALAYPCMLMSVSVVVILCTLLTVVPRFAGMFQSLGAELPQSTATLLWISGAMQAYWWAILLVLGGGGFGAYTWVRSTAGKRIVHTAAIRAPLVGNLVRDLAVARVCRLLGVLLTSRVPLLEALELTRQASALEPIRKLIDDAEESVTDGNTLSEVFVRCPLISPSISAAARSAEESGRLGDVLSSLADHMDEDNAVIVKTLSSVIEPAILGVLGVVVGFVALSLFLPLFDLTSAAGGH
jgi:type II secretory pathway component PulF